ncbi:hypothetical protein CANINC_002122 [Pichia inconspicua]|uniref:RING-type domain-containing protein n=1 Tax=Pichia inconspicua TaxID=52247 RepID=A0A4T0X3L6_9ASCO|nr:hypothetical protein CANINC_002122 [[Candida] inconspicua]
MVGVEYTLVEESVDIDQLLLHAAPRKTRQVEEELDDFLIVSEYESRLELDADNRGDSVNFQTGGPIELKGQLKYGELHLFKGKVGPLLKLKVSDVKFVSQLVKLLNTPKTQLKSMFKMKGFYIDDLKREGSTSSFKFGYMIAIRKGLFNFTSVKYDFLFHKDETQYQLSCNDKTSSPDVDSFYSLITENTRENYCSNKEEVNIEGINKTLLPFQAEAVKWMLNHEGYNMDTKSTIKYGKDPDDNELSIILDEVAPYWERVRSDSGQYWWYNPVSGALCDRATILDYLASRDYNKVPATGFLCEEMGLGKTLEITSVVALNPRKSVSEEIKSDEFNVSRKIKESKTTVIVCPETILSQWYEEITSTCETLSVYKYEGIKVMEETDPDVTPSGVADFLKTFDIVLVAYTILGKEVDRASFVPTERPKRGSTKRIDYSSPLMLLEFYRLVIDEAQLASMHVSRVAQFCKILPRVHTWCVSGTIIRNNLQDLHSLLGCQRMYPLDRISTALWKNIPRYVFDRLFKKLCLRHTKEMVGSQIQLPKQTRIMLRSPFSTIESDNYYDLFNRFLDEVGLDTDGNPTGERYDYERSHTLMRKWSSKLRMACCHAMLSGDIMRRQMYSSIHDVEKENANQLKNNGYMIGTLDDVLADLINTIELETSTLFTNYIKIYTKMGKIHEFLRNPVEAAKLFNMLIERINEKLSEYENYVDKATNNEKQKTWKTRIRGLLEYLHQACFMLASAHYQHYRPMRPLPDNFDDLLEIKEEDSPDENEKVDPETLNEEERKHYELENFYYLKANEILTALLDDPLKRTQEMIKRLELLYTKFEIEKVSRIPTINSDTKDEVHDLPLVAETFHCTAEELESYAATLGVSFIVTRAKEAISQLNDQALIINLWFKKLYELQKQPVTANDADEQGEEYNKFLILQEESQAYIDQLQLALDDRERAINSTEDMLVYSGGPSKMPKIYSNNEPKTSLETKLEEVRRYFIPQGTINPRYSFHTAILELVGELQTFIPNTTKYDETQKLIIMLKDDMKNQMKNIKQMKTKIFETFNDCFNAKVAYFKSLQIRSDTLVNYSPEKLGSSPKYVALMEMESLKKELTDVEMKMKMVNVRLNYLSTLSVESKTASEDSDMCIICRYKIKVGMLTPCGHKYCRECLTEWMRTKRICPLCNKHLNVNELYNFTYSEGGLKGDIVESIEDDNNSINKKEDDDIEEEINIGKVDEKRLELLKNRRIFENDINFVYQGLPNSELRRIINIQLKTSYGTKVDMIIRQIKYLKMKEPNVQILIFSQWNAFLFVLGRAMSEEGIKFFTWNDRNARTITKNKKQLGSRLSQNILKFKNDSSYTCFLMNTIAQAAGITLTNASHVFLCEPMVSLSLELQAVNRIHRIGQKKETKVWNFIIESSIEESIAYLSTKKRIQASKDRLSKEKIDEIDETYIESKELTKINKSTVNEGEIIGDDDLWATFFASKAATLIDNMYRE